MEMTPEQRARLEEHAKRMQAMSDEREAAAKEGGTAAYIAKLEEHLSSGEMVLPQ